MRPQADYLRAKYNQEVNEKQIFKIFVCLTKNLHMFTSSYELKIVTL